MIDDFQFLQTLGKGAYGTVKLVEHKKTKQKYALKEISKEMVLKHDKIKAVFREQNIHENMSECRYIINLKCTFQDDLNLYFLMEFAENGSL